MQNANATRPEHGPADHPKVARGKTGVLLANLGTPDSYTYWPMRRYLNQFLSDKRVIAIYLLDSGKFSIVIHDTIVGYLKKISGEFCTGQIA